MVDLGVVDDDLGIVLMMFLGCRLALSAFMTTKSLMEVY
jgi:hypothetical protein